MKRKVFATTCFLVLISYFQTCMCQKFSDVIYFYSPLAGEEKFMVDNTNTIINYSDALPEAKRISIKRKLSSMIDKTEDFGDGTICPALTQESIHNICKILDADSIYISFSKKLYLANNTEVWTSNSITIKPQSGIEIEKFLKDNNIAYYHIDTLGNNEYSIYLNGATDVSFEFCNILNKEINVKYACPNFNFFIKDNEHNVE